MKNDEVLRKLNMRIFLWYNELALFHKGVTMFTIRDLLNIGDLQDITLITDDQGMDNVITHAITMDNPEMAH